MLSDDPVSVLERWVDFGAYYRVVELSSERAVVELRTCHGEPVDWLESGDPRLIEYLRQQP
jgi:hypothetical protein